MSTDLPRPGRFLPLVTLLATALGPGCVTMDEEPTIAPDTPVISYRSARELRGAPMDTIAAEAVRTRATASCTSARWRGSRRGPALPP